MAIDRSLDVMAAIRAALLADAQVTAIIGQKIYDTAPETVGGAFITIGDVGYTDFSTSDTEGQDITIDVHCFDVPADRANVKNTANVRALMGHVRRILHRATLSVPGRNVIVCSAVSAVPPVADADEIHGVVILRVLAGHE